MRITRCISLLLLLAVSGCGGGAEDAAEDAGTPPSRGTVTGVVTYTGTQQGDLIVAAFTSWPTAWAPEMFVKVPSPSFPQAYTLEGLDEGDYYIFAFVDVPPVSPTIPGTEDVRSTPTATVHVSAAAPATADVALPAE
jgi:hypothetical protein